MSLTTEHFLESLAVKPLRNVDLAVGAIWHKSLSETSAALSVKEICDLLETAGYSRQNSARMRLDLESDQRTLKAEGDSFKLNPKLRAQVDEAFQDGAHKVEPFLTDGIHQALEKISLPLANSYKQVKLDIQDMSRISWAGTAHEIRQITSSLLHHLAPDAEVKAKDWYKLIPNTSGPTQSQRVRFIFEERGLSSAELNVAAKVSALDGLVEDLVRANYSRASDAAHTFKARDEVIKIMRYFNAFIPDILGI